MITLTFQDLINYFNDLELFPKSAENFQELKAFLNSRIVSCIQQEETFIDGDDVNCELELKITSKDLVKEIISFFTNSATDEDEGIYSGIKYAKDKKVFTFRQQDTQQFATDVLAEDEYYLLKINLYFDLEYGLKVITEIAAKYQPDLVIKVNYVEPKIKNKLLLLEFALEQGKRSTKSDVILKHSPGTNIVNFITLLKEVINLIPEEKMDKYSLNYKVSDNYFSELQKELKELGFDQLNQNEHLSVAEVLEKIKNNYEVYYFLSEKQQGNLEILKQYLIGVKEELLLCLNDFDTYLIVHQQACLNLGECLSEKQLVQDDIRQLLLEYELGAVATLTDQEYADHDFLRAKIKENYAFIDIIIAKTMERFALANFVQPGLADADEDEDLFRKVVRQKLADVIDDECLENSELVDYLMSQNLLEN